MALLVFGHKNPDTDTIAASISVAKLKQLIGSPAQAHALGSLNKETAFVLDYFKVKPPAVLENVKTQIKDIDYYIPITIPPDTSILKAYKIMEQDDIRTLPVVDNQKQLLGLVTMKDIAIELIKGDFQKLTTSLSNIVEDLQGRLLVHAMDDISGKVSVIAYYYETIAGYLDEDDIIIVGDRYDIIEHAIYSKVQLIIITGNVAPPEKFLALAKEKGVNLVSVATDTYTTAKLINKCKFVSFIMKSKDLLRFSEDDYLEDIKDDMIATDYRNYPIVTDENIFQGFINKRHLLNPGRKKVILVDHNEYAQSAEGLHEAEILEIIDHHKIGDISTSIPISFRNIPVGSTCTIVFNLFKEHSLIVPYDIAGLLIAGIISDTLFFKSPTTTDLDRQVVEELNKILNLDLSSFAMDMFKAGTSLEGYDVKEIFFKDFKEFTLEGNQTGMGQIFTLDIEDIMKRKNELISFINTLHLQKGYYLTLLLITDILKEGSYLFFKCNNTAILSTAFNVKPDQGVFVEGLVSRKKQVVPKILEAINMLK